MSKNTVEKNTGSMLKFTKEQILNSKRFADRKVLVMALLEDDKLYMLDEVEDIIQAYLKRPIPNRSKGAK